MQTFCKNFAKTKKGKPIFFTSGGGSGPTAEQLSKVSQNLLQVNVYFSALSLETVQDYALYQARIIPHAIRK